MSIVKQFQKTEVERRRLYLDYSCWLEDSEQLNDFQATVYPYTVDKPLTLDIAYTDVTNKKLSMFASGGAPKTNYTVQMIVRTTGGQTKRDDIGIRVTP
jgi:hypothetical protein